MEELSLASRPRPPELMKSQSVDGWVFSSSDGCGRHKTHRRKNITMRHSLRMKGPTKPLVIDTRSPPTKRATIAPNTVELKRIISTFTYRIEAQPEGGFVAHASDPNLPALQAPTRQELQQKIQANIGAA